MQNVRSEDFDRIVERNHVALDAFAKGDHQPLADLWSRGDDITLGNPFGPFVRGFDDVVETMKRAAAFYHDGEAVGFDRISEHIGDDFACIVEVERFRAKMGERDDVTPLSLRCTSVFRREQDGWRLIHRHADPITTLRGPESVVGHDSELVRRRHPTIPSSS
jgi:ketosteroid isomerase-like protein